MDAQHQVDRLETAGERIKIMASNHPLIDEHVSSVKQAAVESTSPMVCSVDDMPCPECGKRGYTPHDALWAIRCTDPNCRLWKVGNVLTRKQWRDKQNGKDETQSEK